METDKSIEPRIINPSPSPEDEFAEYRPLIRAISRKVIQYGLATPMILLLEAHKPIHWILSQGLHGVNPTLSVATELFKLASNEDLDRLARFVEDRKSFDVFIEEIERQEELRKKLKAREKLESKQR